MSLELRFIDSHNLRVIKKIANEVVEIKSKDLPEIENFIKKLIKLGWKMLWWLKFIGYLR